MARVQVFVRGKDNYRLLSFERPPDTPQSEFLEASFAVDGTSIVGEVTYSKQYGVYVHPLGTVEHEHRSLIEALACAQRSIGHLFDKYGHDTEFV